MLICNLVKTPKETGGLDLAVTIKTGAFASVLVKDRSLVRSASLCQAPRAMRELTVGDGGVMLTPLFCAFSIETR
jgi:hypothetical protein